jgi:lycopene cyclase domain-containing protein
MSTYTILNIGLALIALPASIWITVGQDSWAIRRLAARISTLMMCIVYPWDFVAIHLQLWTYGDSIGPRLFEVPLNDLLLTWLCSYLTCSVLLVVERREAGRQG